jgi:hypothetical protein
MSKQGLPLRVLSFTISCSRLEGDHGLLQGLAKNSFWDANFLTQQTCRALRVLQTADLIMAEDTRHSSKLLSYFGIKTPMISFHLHNEQSREAEALQKLRAGKVVAVISDAGMPGISDPGMELVRRQIVTGCLLDTRTKRGDYQ